MPTPTYTPLATVTLGGTASSVTFSSIPASYRDLIIVISGTASQIVNIAVQFNGDTGANFSFVNATGTGAAAASLAGTAALSESGRMNSTESNTIFQVMDYSATDKHTTMLGRGNSSGDLTEMSATRWANTAAVTSVKVISHPSPRTFSTGTTFSLYGVIA
jgi:hypothetical protein